MKKSELEKEMKQIRADMKKVNETIRQGKKIYIDTFLGKRQLAGVSGDFWYHTTDGRSWCGCNDSTWRSIKKQAGVKD